MYDETNLLSLVRLWYDNNYHKQTKNATVCYNVYCDLFSHYFTDLTA